MERTLGFDFGTHQTKICIEEKDGANIGYHFFPFRDTNGNITYMLPSVIRINTDRTLSYGHIDEREGEVIRYFKQASYCTEDFRWSNEIRADYFSIWYIAFILFHIENEFETNFATQMGVPTDTANLDVNKRRAVCLMLSAIRLVEDVFHNDLDTFLSCKIDELFSKTTILDYSPQLKEEFQIYVFPEAYACLRPLTTRGKIAAGMSLMVDIGGGTTDISFFTLASKGAQIYKFISIPKGLNFLTGVDGDDSENENDSKVVSYSELIPERIEKFESIIHRRLTALQNTLETMFKKTCDLRIERLLTALRNRPIVYCGGGSTFEKLCKGYIGFSEVRRVSTSEWNMSCFPSFEAFDLCPILNTSYGLSISATSDQIDITPLKTLFNGLRDAQEETPLNVDERPSTPTYLGQKDFIDRWNELYVGGGKKKSVTPRSTKSIEARMKGFENKVRAILDKPSFGVCRSSKDVDEFLSFYYSVVSPIGEKFIKQCAGFIKEDALREEFLTRCEEWNKECSIILEQRRKDISLAVAMSQKKVVFKPAKPKRKRKRFKSDAPISFATNYRNIQQTSDVVPEHHVQSNNYTKNESPTNEPNVMDTKEAHVQSSFNKGDKVSFLDTVGFGVVKTIDINSQSIEVETDEGFVITIPVSKCVKMNVEEQYFQNPPKISSSLNEVILKPHEPNKEEVSQEEKQMKTVLAALMEKFNRKK